MTASSLPSSTYLIGALVDVHKRVRYVPPGARMVSCDPLVTVFSDKGHFVVLNLQPGRTYDFMIHHRGASKRWRFTPKAGVNDLQLDVRSKRPTAPTAPRRGAASRAGA